MKKCIDFLIKIKNINLIEKQVDLLFLFFFGFSVNYTLLQINLHLITTPPMDAHASPFSAYHYHLGPLHSDTASSTTSDET